MLRQVGTVNTHILHTCLVTNRQKQTEKRPRETKYLLPGKEKEGESGGTRNEGGGGDGGRGGTLGVIYPWNEATARLEEMGAEAGVPGPRALSPPAGGLLASQTQQLGE